MEKRAIIALISILVLSFFLIKFDITSPEANYAKIGGNVVSELENQENVRVKIKLKADIEDINGDLSIASEDAKASVEDILDNKIKHEFEDEVSAYISEEDLAELSNDPNVESIELVGTRNVVLQDSVPLINASVTHDLQVNGVNLTGEGETICIIDTGADLSHSGLGGCYGDNDPDSSCKILGGFDYCADDTTCTTIDATPNDVHGHGSHVAGIAAGSGPITGVAPGANLIIIKAANSSGTFWDDDLEKAIDWCVNNASEFDISVISMSLGGGLSSDYCNSDPLADEIDNAIANNISVIVATGNDGSTTQINGPSCVQNATPVGGTDKSDGMYSNGNRNSLVKLLAPGVTINSTIPTDTYSTLSGTSMSTPHVAGAFAIIIQYLRLDKDNTVYSPEQIESLLETNGKSVDDSGGSGLSYARVNIYDAIYSLDDSVGEVALSTPLDNSYEESENSTFVCNASDLLGLNNVSFYLWNSSGANISTVVYDLSGNYSYSAETNITGLVNGTYTWNCLAEDTKGNTAWASNNFTKKVGNFGVTLSSPENEIFQTTNNVNFTCVSNNTVSPLESVTLYVWNSSSNLVYNETVNATGSSNVSTFNYSLPHEDSFEWNCHATDSDSGIIYANSNYTINYDITGPNITLEGPEDDYTSEDEEVDFEYIVDEESIENCSLIIENEVNQTDTSVSAGDNEFSNIELPEGTYDWKVRCYDSAGNMGVSGQWRVKVDLPSASSNNDDDDDDDDSGSSGGAGGAATTPIIPAEYSLNAETMNKGTTKMLASTNKLRFKVNNADHSLTVDTVYASRVKVTVASDPVTLMINVGETKKLDLTNDNIYDLLVKLENIDNVTLKANLTVQTINEPIGTRTISEESNETVGEEELVQEASAEGEEVGALWFGLNRLTWIIIISILSAAALAGLGYLIYKKGDVIFSKLGLMKK